jgi:sugar/nucleoside kinase (ribokinase family)
VAFIGKSGDDEFGRFMQRELAARGVDTSGIVVDSSLKTGLTVILSRGNDRAPLTYLGSIAALRYEEINQTLLKQARHLHLGSLFLLHNLLPDIPRLFATAQANGLTTSVDTNYDPAEQWDNDLAQVFEHTDIFLPNQTELCAIAGQAEVRSALNTLSQRIPLIAVKLGPDGAMAQRGREIIRAEALPITVVDSTGAGDSFDAGFIYGYLAGWELARSLRMACVCGALSTRAAGGTAAQATLAEALALV